MIGIAAEGGHRGMHPFASARCWRTSRGLCPGPVDPLLRSCSPVGSPSSCPLALSQGSKAAEPATGAVYRRASLMREHLDTPAGKSLPAKCGTAARIRNTRSCSSQRSVSWIQPTPLRELCQHPAPGGRRSDSLKPESEAHVLSVDQGLNRYVSGYARCPDLLPQNLLDLEDPRRAG